MGRVADARAQGYSEEEINAFLAPKIAEAQAQGYGPKEIGEYLGVAPVDHKAASTALSARVQHEITKAKTGGRATAMQQMGQTVKDAATVYAPVEAAFNLATGVAFGFPGYLLGGIGGLIARHTYSPDTDPKEIATRYAEVLTYHPRTEAGERFTGALTYPLKVLMEFSEESGKDVADKTGSAGLASITEATIQMLPAFLIPAFGRRVHGKTPTNSDIYTAAQELAPAASPPVKTYLSQKIQAIYEKTGVDPVTLREMAIESPAVMADLVSSNLKVPREVMGAEIAKAIGDPAAPGGLAVAAGGAGGKPPPAAPLAIEPAPTPKPTPVPGTPEAAQTTILERISVGEPTLREHTLSKFYTAVKDDLYPIAKIEKAMSEGVPLVTAESPYRLARLVRGAAGKAEQFLEHSTFDWATFKDTGPGLRTILKPFENDLNGFRAYAVSRRAEELHTRGIETGVPAAEARIVVEAGGKYTEAFEQLQTYQGEMTRYMKDAGLISEKAFAAMLEANKDYVPFHRLFTGESSGAAGGGLSTRNPLRAIKGSERVILDPLESMIKNTYLYTALAERNAVGAAFGKMVEANPELALALGVKPVPAKLKPITLDAREIRKLFEEFVTVSQRTTRVRTEETKTSGVGVSAGEPQNKVFQANKTRVEEALTTRGFSENEAAVMIKRLANKEAKGGDTLVERLVQEVVTTERSAELNIRLPNDVATIFRPNAMRPAPNQIQYFEGGKAKMLELPLEVADAFTAADQGSIGMLTKLLAIPARTLRAGAILTPDFMLRNVARDQLSAFAFSKNGYIPVWDMLKGAMSISKRDGDMQAWLKSGGANSAMVSIDRSYLQQHLKSLNDSTGLMGRTWNYIGTPLEVLRISSELLENATRLGEFKRGIGDSTGKAAIQEAGFQSREVTLDFQRIGAQTRGLNMIAAFMNAGLEGLDRTVRAFKDRPLATTSKVAASVTMPSILLWYANNNTPERQARWREIPNWQRDLFWIVMTEDNTYRIPKPFEVGVIFGSTAERLLDQFAADKPDAMKDFMKSVGAMAMINVFPTGAVPLLEQTTNHSFFTGNPLIPRRLEGLLPEYQYHEYTSELTKAVGKAVGAFPGLRESSIASPIVIDNYIRGWTGGLGTYAMQILDAGLRTQGILPDPPLPLATLADIPVVKAFVVRYPSASAQSVQDFYREYAKRKTVYDTIQHLASTGDGEAAIKLLNTDPSAFSRMEGIQSAMGALNKTIRLVHGNPQIPPVEQRQLIDSMYGQLIELARAGNKAMRETDGALEGRAPEKRPAPAPQGVDDTSPIVNAKDWARMRDFAHELNAPAAQ